MSKKLEIKISNQDEFEVVKYIVAVLFNMKIISEEERDKILREYK